ncbi:MAG: Rieske (2Fe-2S) protein [Oligoflexales bacterium]|nr:Rieske (2Fe-2S) protein [Oligoflexales bacterium]
MQKLLLIASYKRHIASNHERMFENVFDWEHLPHLHPRTFSSISLLAKGKKTLTLEAGLWPTPFGLKQKIRLQGCKRKRTWIVRVLSGFMTDLIVRSRVSYERSDGFDVRVDFLVPFSRWYYAPLGPALKYSYARLYKEDVAMMTSRQHYLERKPKPKKTQAEHSVLIGKASDLKCPHLFTFQGNPFLINQDQGKWIAYTAHCPHLGRSFKDLKIKSGKILCPWHGYEFELASGLSRQSKCRLPLAPKIISKSGLLFAIVPELESEKQVKVTQDPEGGEMQHGLERGIIDCISQS